METKRSQWLVAGIAVLVWTLGVAHAVTPAQKCQSGKNAAAGKYSDCRQKAEAKFAAAADSAKRTQDLAKCEAKFQSAWVDLEAKAVAQGGACPSVGDRAAVQAAIDQQSGTLATALGGGGPAALPLGQVQQTGQTQCFDGNFPWSEIACEGTGQDGLFQKGLSRAYRDDGIGTVKDTRTGLEWEKATWDGSIHDQFNVYTWPEAITKIEALNAAAYAGFTDWRWPNIAELASLLENGGFSPAVNPSFNVSCTPGCTVLTCSCTESPSYYWSSTTFLAPGSAWVVEFALGNTTARGKNESNHVRAVRGGS